VTLPSLIKLMNFQLEQARSKELLPPETRKETGG
jgi:hypothetical protein